jgi:O-antigen/teichoic acid export membrane protein
MVRRALAMAAGEQYFRLAIQFGLIAIVSRLLTPTEIGVSVIGTGIAAIALGIREFATSDFLIQRHKVSRDDVRTSFTVLLLLTVLITCAMFAFAPLFATFFGEENLARFIQIAAVAGLIEAISKPITGLLRRDMAFGVLAMVNTASAAAAAVVTVLLALAGFSYMSVAWATVAAAGTTTLLSFYFRPDVSSFRPSFKSWRSMLAFGGYNGASHVINQTYERLPQLFLGGLLPPSAVGLYNRAAMVSEIPQMIFLTSVFSVAFPALAAEIRQGRSLKDPYLRALSYITVFYWPALALLATLAYPVVSIVLGQQWLSIVPLLRVMALAYLAWFPVILTVPVLLAVGANRDRVLVHLIARPVSAVILCSAAYFGIMAMAASQLAIVPFLMIVSLYFVRRHVDFRWRELWAALWKSAVVTAGTAAGPVGVVLASDSGSELPIAAAVGAVLLAGIGWLVGVLGTRHPLSLELKKALGAVEASSLRRLHARIIAGGGARERQGSQPAARSRDDPQQHPPDQSGACLHRRPTAASGLKPSGALDLASEPVVGPMR